jgi:hypothetical protein
MPMAFVRCYTGTDGQSHFEDLDLLPPEMERSIEQAASSITFTRSPNGRFSDWHDDSRTYHGVTAVTPLNPRLPAYRDVLVVTFRRE